MLMPCTRPDKGMHTHTKPVQASVIIIKAGTSADHIITQRRHVSSCGSFHCQSLRRVLHQRAQSSTQRSYRWLIRVRAHTIGRQHTFQISRSRDLARANPRTDLVGDVSSNLIIPFLFIIIKKIKLFLSQKIIPFLLLSAHEANVRHGSHMLYIHCSEQSTHVCRYSDPHTH